MPRYRKKPVIIESFKPKTWVVRKEPDEGIRTLSDWRKRRMGKRGQSSRFHAIYLTRHPSSCERRFQMKRRLLVWWLKLRHGDQWWFWTPEWQAGEREADADIAAGRTQVYTNAAEFLASLDDEHGSK